jgi:hypothetical protein
MKWLAIFLLLIFLIPTYAGVSYMTGSGTLLDPYVIYNATDLQNVSLDLAAYYILANDIDASATIGWNVGAGFDPIGSFVNPFTGHFDGKNYTISNLYINRPAETYVGLFADLSGATVSNIKMTGVNITGLSYVGGITGGVARNNPVITNCSVQGAITANNLCGGIAGSFDAPANQTNSSSATDCSFSGTITCAVNDCGGIVGYDFGGIFVGVKHGDLGAFTRCFSSGSIACAGANVGGIVGGSGAGITFIGCTSSMSIAALNYAGGIAGLTGAVAKFSGCNSTGNITSSDPADASSGGLVGLAGSGMDMDDCYATGNVLCSGDDAGGLIGSYGDNSTIDKCYATGNVIGLDDCGGLVGVGGTGTVNQCFATGSVIALGDYAGGLLGYASCVINNCYARGNVQGNDWAGGFVGYLDVGSVVTNCYSTGSLV